MSFSSPARDSSNTEGLYLLFIPVIGAQALTLVDDEMSDPAGEDKTIASEPAQHTVSRPLYDVVNVPAARDPIRPLDVVDVPFDGRPPMLVLHWTGTTDLRLVLESLQPPPKGTARVFEHTSLWEQFESKEIIEVLDALNNYLHLTYGLPLDQANSGNNEPETDIRNIVLQWTQGLSDSHFKKTPVAKLESRSFLGPVGSLYGVMSWQNSTFQCWKHDDDNLISMLTSQSRILSPYLN
jgi:hypothetical protein